MKILPTLNIQNGVVVPVVGAGEVTGDLLAMVGFLQDQGCHRLALVDVDAARGLGNNRELIAKAMHRFHAGRPKVCIQVGGGIRSSDQAQFFMDHGAAWLIVGTILHRSPVMVEQLLARFHEQLTAAVDARGGEILASGWGGPCGPKASAAGGLQAGSFGGLQAGTVGSRIGDFGFKRLLFMDLPAGPSSLPDFATARLLAQSSRLGLYMGGSIRTLEHLAKAREVPGMHGVAVDGLLLRDNPAFTVSLNLPGC